MARFALILALAVSVAAQDAATLTGTVKTENGLHVATFDTLQGTVTVNLPDDLAAGDTISGTVVAEPKGETPDQKAANSDSLSGVVVEVAKQETPASDGKGKWIVPAAAAVAIPLILRNREGREIGKVNVPVAKAPRKPEGFQIPAAGQSGKPVAIAGSFDGDFATSGVKLAGNAMNVLAESPRKLIAQAPANFSGTGEIEVSEGDVVQKCEFRNVVIKLAAPTVNLKSGQTTTMTITVEGLAGLDKPFPVSVVNRSPSVVKVAQGDVQSIQVDPKKVANGSYVTTRTLTGVVPGGFNINATISPGAIATARCVSLPRPAPRDSAASQTPMEDRPSTTTGASSRPPELPGEDPPPPPDPERLRNATVLVHTGTEWRELADGNHILTYRDNPPMTGVLSLDPGTVFGAPTGTYPLVANPFWRTHAIYQIWSNSDHKFTGTGIRTFRDADNPEGELGIAAAGRPRTEREAWSRTRFHANGLQLEPAVPVNLMLLRRGKGRPWTTVGNANGTVQLAAGTVIVPVAIALLHEEGRITPQIDLATAQVWFDGRAANRVRISAGEESSEAMILDQDAHPGWSVDRLMEPGTGRLRTHGFAQDPDLVWSQCGRYNANIQFRLVRHGTIEASSSRGRCRTPSTSTPLSGELGPCVGGWAEELRRVTGDSTPAITIVFTADRTTAGVAEAFETGIHVGWGQVLASGNDQTRTLAHEIGHVFGFDGPLGVFNDDNRIPGNLMNAGGPDLTREQCEVAYRRARVITGAR